METLCCTVVTFMQTSFFSQSPLFLLCFLILSSTNITHILSHTQHTPCKPAQTNYI